MVINVITSCSLLPASRARKPPIAWMPSCELPAILITASDILETLGLPPVDWGAVVASLMKNSIQKIKQHGVVLLKKTSKVDLCCDRVSSKQTVSISNKHHISLSTSSLRYSMRIEMAFEKH